MELVTCSICGKNNEQELYKTPDFRVVICKTCSLGYLNPRMNSDEYSKHYKESYQKARHNITDYDQAIVRLKRKNSYDHKKQHLPFLDEFLKESKSVFEIGAGWGTLLKVIQDTYPVQVSGIEISELAAQVAIEYYKLPIEKISIEDFLLKKDGGKYDLILMHHVLEHTLDPLSILRQLKPFLSSTGKLYIAVPNLQNPDESLDKYFRLEHPYYFNPYTLVTLFHRAGYKVLKAKIGLQDMRFVVSVGDPNDEPASIITLQKPINYQSIVSIVKRRSFFDSFRSKIKAMLQWNA